MNPTVILSLAVLVIDTAIAAIQLIKKQKRRKKRGVTH